MGETSAVFNLKVAKGLIQDVAAQIEDVIQFRKPASDALAEQDWESSGFWEALKTRWKAESELQSMKADLERAIDLATKVSQMDPNLVLDDGSTPESVIAEAHYQAGLIEFRLGRWEQALKCFAESFKVVATQSALFGVALCQLAQMRGIKPLFQFKSFSETLRQTGKRSQELKAAKEKGVPFGERIKLGAKGYIANAFLVGLYSREEIKQTLEKVIEMDPGSEIALEAGKILARLERR